MRAFLPAAGLATLLLGLAPLSAVLPTGHPLAVVGEGAVAAQDRDVELLGEVYGTRPPATYFDVKARDPSAFTMGRGMGAGRGLPADGAGAARLRAPGVVGVPAFGARRVVGTFRFPVVLGLFADSPPPAFPRALVQSHFFDGPNPTGTIPDLYHEMSGGAVRLFGEVSEWVRTPLRQDSVTRGVSGLGGSSRVGEFIMELLSRLPPGTDWGRYDNDGPDGVPNSGDDDGYVDVLAVVHPTPGAECGGPTRGSRIWSHKWTLRDVVGQEYVTRTPTPSGGRVRIDDYTIQPVESCDGGRINEIGVFAHELGHGFGLPDLYASNHAGVGRWDLMGTGSWGCSAFFDPARPCHMGAWSKAMLGWIDVEEVPFGSGWTTWTLDPVETGGGAVALPAGDGSGEYFLVENRQRIGFDASLPETGLLVWHVDPWIVDTRLRTNSVNDSPGRMGVWLRQADGLNQLGLSSVQGGNRGDAGDPFTGNDGRSAFHAATDPGSFTHVKSGFEQGTRGVPPGGTAGVTVTDVERVGQSMRFRALARYQTVRIRAEGEAVGSDVFTVDGVARAPGETVLRSSPFQRHTIEAAAGAPLAEGVRRGFSGWADAPGEGLRREWTTGDTDADLVAVYGGAREMRVRVTLEGERFGVAPGEVRTTPGSVDLWFDEGTQVAFTAEPTRGFSFREWGEAFAGLPNPAVVPIDQPRDAVAVFDLVFGLDPATRLDLPAAVEREIQLVALHANEPVVWTLVSGELPLGLTLGRSGVVRGAALEAGEFPVQLAAQDALGLETGGFVTVRVSAPVLGTDALAAPFLLLGGGPTEVEREYLDRAGNADGRYDLGDLRAWLLANPDAPTASPPAAPRPSIVPVLDFAPDLDAEEEP